ncbi:MAG: DUF3592 domain-containing protein [Chloroflexi bacterium]|nr:DUF3592 domain-containing protein [Chloroflexota bacterium]
MGTKKVWKGIKDKWFTLSREEINDFIGLLIILYIAALLLFLFIGQDGQLRVNLALEGVTTQAIVLRCALNARTVSITYQFEVAQNGQSTTYKNGESSSSAFCSKHPRGSQIIISYLPQDPSQAVVQGNSQRGANLTCLIITLIYPWGSLILKLIKAKRKERKE